MSIRAVRADANTANAIIASRTSFFMGSSFLSTAFATNFLYVSKLSTILCGTLPV
jgi:hypothetical protein